MDGLCSTLGSYLPHFTPPTKIQVNPLWDQTYHHNQDPTVCLLSHWMVLDFVNSVNVSLSLYFSVRTSIMMGYVGWMAYVLQLVLISHTSLLQQRQTTSNNRIHTSLVSKRWIKIGFVLLGLMIVALLVIQSSPWMYYVYCLMPVPLWFITVKQ